MRKRETASGKSSKSVLPTASSRVRATSSQVVEGLTLMEVLSATTAPLNLTVTTNAVVGTKDSGDGLGPVDVVEELAVLVLLVFRDLNSKVAGEPNMPLRTGHQAAVRTAERGVRPQHMRNQCYP